MTAQELIRYQLDDAGYQLDQVLAGFPESALDTKGAGEYTPREMVAHLCEAYVAAEKNARNETYEWGSYKVPDCSTRGVLSEFHTLRSKAVDATLGGGDDGFKSAHMFILAHDYYHVGQLASLRITADPEWDAYSIYRQ